MHSGLRTAVLVFLLTGLASAASLSSCSVINTSGSYTLNSDIHGDQAPTPIGGSACVLINTSNVALDCQGHNVQNNGASVWPTYGIMVYGATNVTLNNCTTNGFTLGTYFRQSSSSSAISSTASGNDEGFYLSFSHNITLSGDTAAGNNNWDLALDVGSTTDCANKVIGMTGSGGLPVNYTNTSVSWSNFASSQVILCGASYSNLTNGTVHGSGNNNGITFFRTNNVTLRNITSYGNFEGLVLVASQGNHTVINSNLSENRYADLDITGGIDTAGCRNSFINVTGSGARPINYSYTPVSWSNTTSSEVVLCGADNSNLTNVTVDGSDFLQNNLMYLILSNNVRVDNSRSDSNAFGLYCLGGSGGNYTNDEFLSNAGAGMVLNGCPYSRVINNTGEFNGGDGIQLYGGGSHDVLVQGNTYYGNSAMGVSLTYSPNNNVTQNLLVNNADGIWIFAATGNNIWNNTAQDNREYDLFNNPAVPSDCVDNVYNNTGSGDTEIKYYYGPNVPIAAGQNVSEMFLCNADGTTADSETVHGNGANNGIVLYFTDFTNVTNSNASLDLQGYYLIYSTHNLLQGDTGNQNGRYGFYLYNSSSNTLDQSTAFYNSQNGFRLDTSSNSNTLSNDTTYYNIRSGFYLTFSNGNTLSEDNATDDNAGYQIEHSNSNLIKDSNATTDVVIEIRYGSTNNTVEGVWHISRLLLGQPRCEQHGFRRV